MQHAMQSYHTQYGHLLILFGNLVTHGWGNHAYLSGDRLYPSTRVVDFEVDVVEP